MLSISNVFAQQDDINTARQYIKQGASFYIKEEYQKSIEYLNKAEVIANKLKNDLLKVSISTWRGHVYLQEGEYQKTLSYYYYSLDILERIGDLDREIIALSGLVTVLKRMGQLDRAHELTLKMLKLTDNASFKNKFNHAAVIATANEIYIALEEYDSVLYFADKGIKIAKNIDSKSLLVHLYVEKGMVFYHKKKYKEAFEYLLKTEALLQNHEIINESFPTALTYYFLASCYYQEQSYDTAILYLLKVINAAKEKDLTKMYVIQCYLLLANCYGEQEDFEKALYWNNEYMRLNASYEKEKDGTANVIYEKESEKLLENIEHLKNKQAKDEHIKKYTYGISGFLTLILITVGFTYFKKQRSNKQRFENLMKKINELESKEDMTTVKKEGTKSLVIDDEKVVEILKKLDKLVDEEYFLKKECSLQSMAKKLKTNASYLSKIINTHKKKNFSAYINDLRIDFVIDRLHKDTKFRKYTIKAIAQDIGFNTSEAFTRVFHKNTGMYPSYFIKELEKRSKS